jgi:hypothetical protein
MCDDGAVTENERDLRAKVVARLRADRNGSGGREADSSPVEDESRDGGVSEGEFIRPTKGGWWCNGI